MTSSGDLIVPDALAPLARKLTRLGLAPDDQAAILDSVASTRRVSAGDIIASLGETSSHVVALLDGLAARYKLGLRGERQLLAFLIAGDFCTVQSGPSARMDHGVSATTACTLAMIPRQVFLALWGQDPRLALTFWQDTAADAAVEREWLFNLGRRNATTRLAHLLCEMHARLERAGLATQTRFSFPVTQNDLADAAGLSTVHVNRSLQTLRRLGLIVFARGEVTVLDREALLATAGFDDAYLDLESSPDPASLTAPGRHLAPSDAHAGS